MKKLIFAPLCAVLALALCMPALAESGAVDVARQSVRGNATFTRESYGTVWITPVYDDHILTQANPEKYPARFMTFSAPAGGCLTKFAYDESDFLDHDSLMGYYYIAYDRASFELFLEDVEADNIISDGADGVAMYVEPDRRLGHALIDLKEYYDGTAKLRIIIDDYSGDVTGDQLRERIQQEVGRVQAEMAIVDNEPGHFWTTGKFNTVEIAADRDPYSAIVGVNGLTVTRIEGHRVITKEPDGRNTKSIEIAVDTYSYPHAKMESVEAQLADGTPYLRYNTDYTGYASFTLTEEGKYGPVYLTIKVDCEPDAFAGALEAAYARVTMKVTE